MPVETMRSIAAACSSAERASKNCAKTASAAEEDVCAADSATPASTAAAPVRRAKRRLPRTGTLRLLSERRFAKSRRVDRHVQLHVGELEIVAAVEPGERPAERELDSADVAVLGVVDLCRHAADRRSAVTHHSYEQTRSIVEVQRRQCAVRTVALDNGDVLVRDRRRWTDAQAGERLRNLRREGEHR